jgi:hypothetical protein
MIMLGTGLIAAVVALAAMYNVFYLGDEALIKSYQQHLTAFPKEPKQAQVIIAAASRQTNVEILAGKSIKGLWAAEGVTVTISDPNSGAEENAASISKERTWSDKIQHNALFERRDPVLIPTSFVLASDAPAGKDLKGKIEGELLIPIMTSEGVQEDAIITLSVPFILRVVSPAEIARVVRAQAKTVLWIASIISLILSAISLVGFKKYKRPNGNARLTTPSKGAQTLGY